eukprot:UN28852
MWRHSKRHVANELDIPAQTEHWVKLRFSSLEEEYYKKLLENAPDVEDVLVDVQRQFVETLRQACDHPQVGRLGNNQHKLMTIDQVSNSLLKNVKVQVAMLERSLCGVLNRNCAWWLKNLERDDMKWKIKRRQS